MNIKIGPRGEKYSRTITFNGREYKNYKQKYFSKELFWDGTIETRGCAPLVVSTILSGYLEDIDPIIIANKMKYGTFDRIKSVINEYGLTSLEILYKDSPNLKEKIITHLNKGYPIIALISSRGVVPFKYSLDNHFIAIIGIEKDELIILNSLFDDSFCFIDDLLNKYINGIKNGFLLIIPKEEVL